MFDDGDSQKSLKPGDGRGTDSLDLDGGMRIMVEKSFVHEVSEPVASGKR